MAVELGMTALLMGLAGGPHCALMCGAACAGIGRAAAPRSQQALGRQVRDIFALRDGKLT